MPETTAHASPKVALVMTGGGARAAYQVGVIRAVSELLPPRSPTPFQILCGTSAGAINVATLAANATHFRNGVRELMTVWKNFHVHHVYRADPLSLIGSGAHWLLALMLGGLGDRNPVSLLDNEPLAELLTSRLDLSKIQEGIDSGALHALSVSVSSYSSGESVCFFQGASAIHPWKRARRLGVPATITIDHLLASSAIPFIFPAVHIGREYFGDGSMRQIAPISPALHLGAERVLVIGGGSGIEYAAERARPNAYPSLAQVAGHALNGLFLDGIEVDLERLQRINRTLDHIPPHVLQSGAVPLRKVEVFQISPSEEIEKIAAQHVHHLPSTIRYLMRGVGVMRRSGSNLASYLLFEKSFCRALIAMGYRDTMQRKHELLDFMGMAQAA
ncbi:MAG: patatin-like phospholipase family protein [Pseudomonadota bacterium]